MNIILNNNSNNLKSRNEYENIAFNEITNNCNINTIHFLNKLNKDSRKCVKFILNNNNNLPETFIPVPFIKNIYEVVTRYQQIIDQFDLVGEVITTEIPINNKKFSKMHYLIMNLYTNHYSTLKEFIDNSFLENSSKLQTINNIENIDKLSVKQLSNWLNTTGKIFSKFLLRIIKNSIFNNADLFTKSLYDIGFKNNLYSDFISTNIQDSIERSFNKVYKYSLIFNLLEANKNNTYRAVVNQYGIADNKLKYYFAAILLVPVLVNKQTIYTIDCWPSKEKKKLNNYQKKSIGCEEVNTGVTKVPYKTDDSEITIFRKEEMHKVILHEFIHATKADFGLYESDWENKIKNWLLKSFKIPHDTKILINESYTEIWAIILNTIICAHHINPSELLCTIKLFFSIEKLFSCFQCAKILNYFEFDNFNDFYNPQGWSDIDRKNTLYHQESSILSYYFIKAALLFRIEFFFHFCGFNNIKTAIKFKQNEANMKNFFKLIIDGLNNKEFIIQINYYLDLLKNNNKKTFEFSTLRMTCIDFLD